MNNNDYLDIFKQIPSLPSENNGQIFNNTIPNSTPEPFVQNSNLNQSITQNNNLSNVQPTFQNNNLNEVQPFFQDNNLNEVQPTFQDNNLNEVQPFFQDNNLNEVQPTFQNNNLNEVQPIVTNTTLENNNVQPIFVQDNSLESNFSNPVQDLKPHSKYSKEDLGMNDETYLRFINLPLDKQEEIAKSLIPEEEPVSLGGQQNGYAKVLSPKGNNFVEEHFKIDQAAFIDAVILAGITAFFSLLSFLIILINAYK